MIYFSKWDQTIEFQALWHSLCLQYETQQTNCRDVLSHGLVGQIVVAASLVFPRRPFVSVFRICFCFAIMLPECFGGCLGFLQTWRLQYPIHYSLLPLHLQKTTLSHAKGCWMVVDISNSELPDWIQIRGIPFSLSPKLPETWNVCLNRNVWRTAAHLRLHMLSWIYGTQNSRSYCNVLQGTSSASLEANSSFRRVA